VTSSFIAPLDMEVTGVSPHMHLAIERWWQMR
jgi:hypothetical protein